MPRKSFDEYSKEEKYEYNVDLFGTIRMLNQADKSLVYGLKVITNKARYKTNPIFNAKVLTERDLQESAQVFDQVFAGPDAFHRKHGTTDLLSNFHGEKKKNTVRSIVREKLKEQGVDFKDRETLDKYCKAYILYSMTSPKEKISYNPGMFGLGNFHEISTKPTYIKVKKEMGGSEAKLPVTLSDLSGLNESKCRWGDTSIKIELKAPDLIRPLDPDKAFLEFEKEYEYDWDAYDAPSFDSDEFDIFKEEDFDIEDKDEKLDALKYKSIFGNRDDLFSKKNIQDVDGNIDDLYKYPDDEKKNEPVQVGDFIYNANIIDDNIININEADDYIHGKFKKEELEQRDSVDLDMEYMDNMDLIDDMDPPVDSYTANINNINNDNNNYENINEYDYEYYFKKNPNLKLKIDPAEEENISFIENTFGKTHYGFEIGDIKEYGKNIRALYAKAHAEDATPQDKINWGVNALQMHFELKNTLNYIKETNPDLLDFDTDVASLKEVFKQNTNYCAKALAENQIDIFRPLMEQTFKEISKLPNKEVADLEVKKSAYENAIAKALYLGKLSHEYKLAHGSDEEVKAWREDILNEVLSDKFDENVENFKQSEPYQKVISKLELNRLDTDSIRKNIEDGLIELAEEKYNEAYHYFGNGVKDQNEINDVERLTGELDEIKTMGITAGASTDRAFGLSFDINMYFDTQYIKKKANLYGQQEDLVNDLVNEKRDEYELSEKINKAFSTNREKVLEKYYEEKKYLEDNKDLLLVIDRYDHYKKKVAETESAIENQYKAIGLDPKIKDEVKKASEKEMKIVELSKEDQAKLKEIEHLNVNLSLYFTGLENAEKEKEALHIDFMTEQDLKKRRKNFSSFHKEMEQKLVNLERDTIKEEHSNEEARKRALEDKQMRLPTELRNEDKEYRDALQRGDTEKVIQIRITRNRRDRMDKLENPHLYEPIICSKLSPTAGSVISRDYNNATSRMFNTYNNYKKKYKIHSDMALDQRVYKSIQQGQAIEADYHKNNTVRPVRPEFKINTFDTEVRPEISLDNVVPEYRIDGYREPWPVPQPNVENNPVPYVEQAFNLMKQFSSKWYGTAEYARIRTNLNTIKETLQGENANVEAVTSLMRKTLIQMDNYLDRKLDERDQRAIEHKNEKDNSRNRRLAVEGARGLLESGLHSLEINNNLFEKDHTIDEVKSEIAVAKELKMNAPEFDTVTQQLNDGNTQGVIDTLMDYIKRNYGQYRNPETGKYSFKRFDDENKKRIPASKEERIFKTLLKCTEKLQNSELNRIHEEEPEKLPEYRSKLVHMQTNDALNGKGVRETFGLNIVYPGDDRRIKSADSITSYAEEYNIRFKTLLNKKKFGNIDMKLYNPNTYESRAVLSEYQNKSMVESVFSNLYLKDLANKEPAGAPFNMLQVEEKRVKFISFVRNTSVYKTLCDLNSRYMDLSGVEGAENVRNQANILTTTIDTPEKYNSSLVANAFVECLSKDILSAEKFLTKPEYNNKDMKAKLEQIDNTIRLANACGLGNVIERANTSLNAHQIHGNNLQETLKKLKDQIRVKNNIKKAEPTKGIKL
ncbi:hypothetical protein SAMN02910369_00697 [Lachnospiraceae bacterium NE2001]|nr:hypothetical protein SAMN02910369_00697 [Lachnospiraceae bacterium NE2001]